MESVTNTSIVILPDASAQTLEAVRAAAGFPLRLYARLPQTPVVIPPMGRAAVPTGITLVLPDLIEAQVVAPRGWNQENPLGILNSPGTIDPDYRGEIHVLLINLSDRDAVIDHGQEVAELKLARFVRAAFIEVDSFDPTPRGKNGLGSTGSS